MATVWSSTHDTDDMQKSINLLISKATQIIVQSRLGMKIKSPCKLFSSGADFFNITLEDLPEVNTEVKKVLLNNLEKTCLPICVDIFLKTVENDTMILEIWSIRTTVTSTSVTYVIYNRMCILLKSLLSITRVTPAYKVSRRQCNESYIICHRIYIGEPHIQKLGEQPKKIALGQSETKLDKMELTVWYRTKVVISPEQKKQEMFVLKSDHFHADLDSRNLKQQDTTYKSLTKSIKAGAFVNISREQYAWSLIIENIPFLSLIVLEPSASGVMMPPSQSSCPRVACSTISTEDLELEEWKGLLGARNANDLGMFYWECRCAPQLISASEQTTLAEQVESVNQFLYALESKIQDYDDMLNLLSSSESFNVYLI